MEGSKMTKILMITETNFKIKSLTPTIHRSSDKVATLPEEMKMALEKKQQTKIITTKNFCHFKENIFIDVTSIWTFFSGKKTQGSYIFFEHKCSIWGV